MEYYFVVRKQDAEKIVRASSIHEIARRKKNYRKSKFFKQAFISPIYSNSDIFKPTLGSIAMFKKVI
jgi:hypothetical protein